MQGFDFSYWSERLAPAPLSERHKQSFLITIRWYLSFCRRGRARVDHASARDFVVWAQQEKQAQEWQVEEWKEALNWFFREAKKPPAIAPHPGPLPIPQTAAGCAEGDRGVKPSGEHETANVHQSSLRFRLRTASPRQVASARHPTSNIQGKPKAISAWKTAFLTVVRRRHYSYRTEQSYMVWLERFARFCRSDDLAARGTEDIKAFLDGLALDQRLSASSQRQALNAVVFLLREVYGKELGDFSDYQRARARTHAPSWLTANEVRALLAQLEGQWALLTCVAFGSGLRLMELLRLRVKDVRVKGYASRGFWNRVGYVLHLCSSIRI